MSDSAVPSRAGLRLTGWLNCSVSVWLVSPEGGLALAAAGAAPHSAIEEPSRTTVVTAAATGPRAERPTASHHVRADMDTSPISRHSSGRSPNVRHEIVCARVCQVT